MNSADYEMARMERIGNKISQLKARGICCHGWIQAPAPSNNLTDVVCLYCGKHFPTVEDAYAASKAAIRG